MFLGSAIICLLPIINLAMTELSFTAHVHIYTRLEEEYTG